MFDDNRSKKVIFVSHCILNQNSISDNTADFPAAFKEVTGLLMNYEIGIVQMPCPELLCLGLDRGDIRRAEREVVAENTRIRKELNMRPAAARIKQLVDLVVFQIDEYVKNRFSVLGIIGINRSPGCGVETTSMYDKEVGGKGVFMETLAAKLEQKGLNIRIIGVKTSEIGESAARVRQLLP
ncbi:MAG: CD3072 family TudS-related putative desulfidase [archaeon]